MNRLRGLSAWSKYSERSWILPELQHLQPHLRPQQPIWLTSGQVWTLNEQHATLAWPKGFIEPTALQRVYFKQHPVNNHGKAFTHAPMMRFMLLAFEKYESMWFRLIGASPRVPAAAAQASQSDLPAFK